MATVSPVMPGPGKDLNSVRLFGIKLPREDPLTAGVVKLRFFTWFRKALELGKSDALLASPSYASAALTPCS